MSRVDTRDVLRDAVRNHRLRLTIIAGSQDTLIPPAVPQQLLAHVLGDEPSEELKSRVSLISIKDAAHLPTLESPHATTKAMLEWLGSFTRDFSSGV